MLAALLIFLGAGTGGVLRYWTIIGTYAVFGKNLPHATIIVNVTGSFLMGLFSLVIATRINLFDAALRQLLLIGLLGGYTTFASFSMDILALLESGRYFIAGLYITFTITLCLLATWTGAILGKLL